MVVTHVTLCSVTGGTDAALLPHKNHTEIVTGIREDLDLGGGEPDGDQEGDSQEAGGPGCEEHSGDCDASNEEGQARQARQVTKRQTWFQAGRARRDPGPSLLAWPLSRIRWATRSFVRSWTRSQRIRTIAEISVRALLTELTPQPAYQQVAPRARQLRELGMSYKAIGCALAVDPKTAAKAITWARGRGPEIDPWASS
jgi:hypothetical protein